MTAIGSKIGLISEVRDLYRAGRFNETLLALRRFDTAEALLLRARTLARLERFGEAHSECSRFSIDDASSAVVAEALVVHAAIEIERGSFEFAQGLIDEARVFVVSAADPCLEAEFLYLQARLAFRRGNDEAAAAHALAVLEVCRPFGLHRSTPSMSLPTSHARALELLGFVRVGNGDLAGHFRYLSDAVAIIDSDPLCDAAIRASIIANFAACAREVDATAASHQHISALCARTAWTPDLQKYLFEIVRSLGWISAVDGDHVSALRSFREASRVGTDPISRLRCHVDRAYLARELGQELFAREEIAEALDAFDTINWEIPVAESFTVIAMLAQLVASSDPDRAELLLGSYESSRSMANSKYQTRRDERQGAIVVFAMGKIAAARGRDDEAIALFSRARETWLASGCAWRAGLAAAELARLGAGARYVALMQAEIASRPRSFYARANEVAVAS